MCLTRIKPHTHVFRGKAFLEIWSRPCVQPLEKGASISGQIHELRGIILTGKDCEALSFQLIKMSKGIPRWCIVRFCPLHGGILQDKKLINLGKMLLKGALDFCGPSTDAARQWKELVLRPSDPGNKLAMVGFESSIFNSPVSSLNLTVSPALYWTNLLNVFQIPEWITLSSLWFLSHSISSVWNIPPWTYSHSNSINGYTCLSSSLQMLFLEEGVLDPRPCTFPHLGCVLDVSPAWSQSTLHFPYPCIHTTV